MKIFHVKSIILGIGIGFIITSIISMVYLAGMKPSTEMSKEDIIKKAREYGMVDGSEFIDKSGENTAGQKKEESKDVKTENSSDRSVNTQSKDQAQQQIQISIQSGDSSEAVADKLLKAGLINDKSAFLKKLTDMNLTTQISVGEYKFRKDTDLGTIIKKITAQ